MDENVKKYKEERERLNNLILSRNNVNIKRFFGLDAAVYRDGALDSKTKELLGLVASLVLRCDDCIKYHALQVKDSGFTDEQFDEVLSIGLIVGGSITIPHIRKATKLWEELKK
ncbi:MAG: carboxymuconolactone decarboxylase family protein [Candidatus Zixiibacteriota bacterium]